MAKTIDLLMNLKDGVSGKLGSINNNLQTTSGKIKALGKSALSLGNIMKGAFVGGVISGFVVDTLKAYDTQIQAEKKVQRALQATGKTAEQAKSELSDYKEFASKQQDITAFGDEATLAVISGLISQGFGKKSIQDIVAMSQDIARNSGSTQEDVTKALSAYVKTGKGATKLAKQFKLNADLLGKGSTETERMASLWQAFSESDNKGASTEYLKTFDGQLESVKGRLADMQEPLGQLMNTMFGYENDPNATPLMVTDKLIQDLTKDIQELANRSSELGGGIGGVGQACVEQYPMLTLFFGTITGAKILTGLGETTKAIKDLGGAISSIANGIATFSATAGGVVAWSVIVIGAITAVAVALGRLSEYYQMTREEQEKFDKSHAESVGAYNYSAVKGAPSLGSIDMSHSKYGKNADTNATGTSYFRGGLTRVNEHGGELITLPSGSQVIPADKTDKMLNGGMTFNVPITIQGNVIGNEEYANQLGDMLVSKLQTAISNC